MSRCEILERTPIVTKPLTWITNPPHKGTREKFGAENPLYQANYVHFAYVFIYLFLDQILVAQASLQFTLPHKLVSNLQQSLPLSLEDWSTGLNHNGHLFLMFCKHWEGNSTEVCGLSECLGNNDHVSYKAGHLGGSALMSFLVDLCCPPAEGAWFCRCLNTDKPLEKCHFRSLHGSFYSPRNLHVLSASLGSSSHFQTKHQIHVAL